MQENMTEIDSQKMCDVLKSAVRNCFQASVIAVCNVRCGIVVITSTRNGTASCEKNKWAHDRAHAQKMIKTAELP